MDKIKIFYLFSDYIEEFNDELTYEDCRRLFNQNKGEFYTLFGFENAFNGEFISDLGMIKVFWNCID